MLKYQSVGIDVLERAIDVIFISDIFLQFRTVYYIDATGEPVTNPKRIAMRYMCSGRLIIDLLASMPVEFMLLFINRTANELNFLRLLKLAKLFRFGKLLTYLTTK